MANKYTEQDDASRFLASLSPEQRRPIDPLTTPEPKPLPSPPSFSAEERAAAEKILKAPGPRPYHLPLES